MLLLFLLCALTLILFVSYKYLKAKEEETLDCFERIDIELRKQYFLITYIISISQKLLLNEQSLINYIVKLKDEAADLGLNPMFINRRIALDKELENKTELLINKLKAGTELSNYGELEDSINSYNKNKLEVDNLKKDYNSSARLLRKAVDVFPTSFIARLNAVKSFDYMK